MKTEDKVRLGMLAALAAAIGGLSHFLPSGKDASTNPSAGNAVAAPADLIDFKFLDRTQIEPGSAAKVVYPPDLAALDNQRVTMVGFMAPFEEIDDMKRFMLLPSYVGCFFCSPPSFTQVVLVEQRSKSQGKLPFINDAVSVTGTLRLYSKDSQHPAHKAEFVYALDDAEAQVATGVGVPVRPATPQPRKPLASDPLAQTPPATATPHKSFQPQFLVPPVSDVRKLPMMRPIKFSPVAPEEIERLVGEQTSRQHSPEEWKARERAFIALGFADAPFDLPRTLTGLELRRTAGFFDPQTDTIFYDSTRQFTKPEVRLEMVKLITEALLAQNVDLRKSMSATDEDAALAASALLFGDLLRTARLYDERIRRLNAKSEPVAQVSDPYPLPPPALGQLWDFPVSSGLAFVMSTFPADKLEKLNAAYASPPRTTAEIIHPERYLDPKSWKPQPVTWPDDRLLGQKPLHTGALGEAGIFVWLTRDRAANPNAVGLRGDRYAVWDGGSEGDTWLIETRWVDETAAAAFEASARAWPAAVRGVNLTNESTTERVYATHVQGRAFRVLRGQDKTRVYVLGAALDARAEMLIKQFVQP